MHYCDYTLNIVITWDLINTQLGFIMNESLFLSINIIFYDKLKAMNGDNIISMRCE